MKYLSCFSGDEASSLAQDSQFQAVYKERPTEAAVWSYLDFRLIRAAGVLKDLVKRKSDNPVVELPRSRSRNVVRATAVVGT